MITGNEPYFPRDERYQGHNGVTIREQFALHLNEATDGWSVKSVIEFMGKECPTDIRGNIEYWAEFKAKIQVIAADALIAELNK